MLMFVVCPGPKHNRIILLQAEILGRSAAESLEQKDREHELNDEVARMKRELEDYTLRDRQVR
jgi:hypothetical protein